MSPEIAFFGYVALLLLLAVLVVVLGIRFVRAHERGAAALEEIARRLGGPGLRG